MRKRFYPLSFLLPNLWLWAVLASFILSPGLFSSAPAEILPPGRRPHPPGVHALVEAKVVPQPGIVLENATIIIRDGLIEAVGKDVKPPADARVWDMKGCTVYAGFIEPYLVPKSPGTSSPPANDDSATAGVTDFVGVPLDARDAGRAGPGSEIGRITPQRRMAESYVPDEKLLESLHHAGFTAAAIAPDRGILRGTSTLVSLARENPNKLILRPDVFQHASLEPEGGRGSYPSSLMGTFATFRQALLDAQHAALQHARVTAQPNNQRPPPFNPAHSALFPVLDQKIPVLFETKSALLVDGAARLAREFNLKFHLVASGQEWRRPELAKAAQTTFIVPVDSPELPNITEEDDWDQVSLDQFRAWDWAPENPALLKQQDLEIALTTHGLADRKAFKNKLRAAIDRGLSETDALAALTVVPATLCGISQQLGSIEPGKRAHLTVVQGGSYFDPSSKIRELWIDGRITRLEVAPDKTPDNPKKKENDDAQRAAARSRAAQSPQTARGPLATPRAVLIRGATLWSSGPQGKIENGSLLVIDGKISKLGGMPITDETTFPEGSLLVIDGQGKHVTPGLIDAHSHAMILGAVNESTLPSTAMVRVSDVVNSETENIYRQLAGGLTIANLLHGSANPIGGQNCVIKLRDGALPDSLKMAGAPAGIKFALGENVKQSGRPNSSRFPQSRMGVGTFFSNRFTAAQQYLHEWESHRSKDSLPSRRDLELEALGEILQGKRQIHCHSYRQDEILAFLRLMEQFKIKVATLQHVLEGYKVADEIARHGAGASCFSDWWGYKFEVYDAIPYAGSLMRNRGVLVSFNSDDADLARRLYLEAAKAVKYGNTPEEEALKFVTINPAIQLGIQQQVGSLEPGKDGDFVIWSGSPLDSSSLCLETWIDGKKYFDRALDSQRAASRNKEWRALLEKARRTLKQPASGEPKSDSTRASFFHVALELFYDSTNRHCDHE